MRLPNSISLAAGNTPKLFAAASAGNLRGCLMLASVIAVAVVARRLRGS
jgi:hypothetical protein